MTWLSPRDIAIDKTCYECQKRSKENCICQKKLIKGIFTCLIAGTYNNGRAGEVHENPYKV